METAIVAQMGLDKEYVDFIAPLMPYCTALTTDYVTFRLPMNLLSGPANTELLTKLFSSFEMQNDIKAVPDNYCSKGYIEMTLGDFRTITLGFKYKPRTLDRASLLNS